MNRQPKTAEINLRLNYHVLNSRVALIRRIILNTCKWYTVTLMHVVLSLYQNCDSTTIRLRHDDGEKLTCSFFARVEWKQARAIYVVVGS